MLSGRPLFVGSSILHLALRLAVSVVKVLSTNHLLNPQWTPAAAATEREKEKQ